MKLEIYLTLFAFVFLLLLAAVIGTWINELPFTLYRPLFTIAMNLGAITCIIGFIKMEHKYKKEK